MKVITKRLDSVNSNSADIIKRQLLIIQLLLEGNYVSTRQIQEHLAKHNIDAKLRSIQRDLVTLEDILPVECRKDDKPYSWRWQRLNNTKLNQLSLSQAIALRLVETELKGVIPNDLYNRLEPLFMKSHFVTGLSQIDNWDTLISQNGKNLQSMLQTEQKNNNSFHAFPSQSIIPTSLLKNLIVSLRVKYEQRRGIAKTLDFSTEITNTEELEFVLHDEEKQLLNRLALNLKESNLNLVAELLTE